MNNVNGTSRRRVHHTRSDPKVSLQLSPADIYTKRSLCIKSWRDSVIGGRHPAKWAVLPPQHFYPLPFYPQGQNLICADIALDASSSHSLRDVSIGAYSNFMSIMITGKYPSH